MNDKQQHLQFVSGPDGAAILDIAADLISTLNPTGAFVWQQLQRGESTQTIVDSLAEETGASSAEIDCDVKHFLSELKEKGLLPL